MAPTNIIIVNSIWASSPSRSFGPYLLRHCLEKRGYSCQVIDHGQDYTVSELFEMIEHFVSDETLCLGFSTTFWLDTHRAKRTDDLAKPPEKFMQVIQMFKSKYPDKKIVLGGAGLRYITDGVTGVDAMVLGDSEDIFAELLDFWSQRGPEPESVKWYDTDIPIYNKCINKTYDISTCDFKWTDRDCILPNEVLPMEVARGCVFKCKFCGYPHLGKKKLDFLRNIEQIKSSLMYNYERWGTTHYIIVDDTFNDTEFKVDEFLKMSKSLPFELKFWAYIRVDLLHHFQGQAEKLKEAGLQGCTIGIETLGPIASSNIGKGWNGKHAREYVPKLVHEIWKDDVSVMVTIIVGLPGDTMKHCEMTKQWIDDCDLSASFTGLHIIADTKHHLTPFLSEFEKNSEPYGIVKNSEGGGWYSKDWTSELAAQTAQRFNSTRKFKRLHSMLHVYARSYGLSHEELINLEADTPVYTKEERIVKLMNDYTQRYRQEILKL